MSDLARYTDLRAAARTQERALFPPQKFPSELELQARWFAGDFGRHFLTTESDQLEIVQFGVWNREAGPDFREAAVSFRGAEAIRGSIEFDLEDRSWETHGHATNPAFEETILHVFVRASGAKSYSRTLAHREVPQVRVDPFALPDAFQASGALAQPGRCQAPFQGAAEDRVRGILEAAAQFRLQRKATRLRNLIEAHGREAAIFHELAAALGYKENKLPFTLLAQRLPLSLLRREPDACEALLFGVAGFLHEADLTNYRPGTRSYLRTLWDRWWPHRDELQRLILPPEIWKLSGARPMNHPQRRLGALAAIVQSWPQLMRNFQTFESAQLASYFHQLEHPFWKTHYTLLAEPAKSEMALVGPSRVAEILANLYCPLFYPHDNEVWARYRQLPARLSNRRLETATARLFADDPRRPAFTKTIAQQQGLLQIYEDFCLQDNSDCARCPFPEQMQKWHHSHAPLL